MSAAGGKNSRPAAVVRGALDVLREDFWGNQTILARLGAGDVFAEVFACLPDVQADVSVCAVQPTQVLFLRTDRLLYGGAAACNGRACWNFIKIRSGCCARGREAHFWGISFFPAGYDWGMCLAQNPCPFPVYGG